MELREVELKKRVIRVMTTMIVDREQLEILLERIELIFESPYSAYAGILDSLGENSLDFRVGAVTGSFLGLSIALACLDENEPFDRFLKALQGAKTEFQLDQISKQPAS